MCLVSSDKFINNSFLYFQLCLVTLQFFLKQSNSLPTNCALTYSDLTSRYLLVKNNYQPQPTKQSQKSWTDDSIKCPWTWQEDEDVNRLPQKIAYAHCRSSCNEWFCKPVKYHTTVLVRERNEWRLQTKEIIVAYVYSKRTI